MDQSTINTIGYVAGLVLGFGAVMSVMTVAALVIDAIIPESPPTRGMNNGAPIVLHGSSWGLPLVEKMNGDAPIYL